MDNKKLVTITPQTDKLRAREHESSVRYIFYWLKPHSIFRTLAQSVLSKFPRQTQEMVSPIFPPTLLSQPPRVCRHLPVRSKDVTVTVYRNNGASHDAARSSHVLRNAYTHCPHCVIVVLYAIVVKVSCSSKEITKRWKIAPLLIQTQRWNIK